MFDFPAWMDEVHIVEMGRNILTGGSDSILIQPSGLIIKPFYYLGPVLQELSFRALGPLGPRLSSLLGLVLSTWAFRWFLLQTKRCSKSTVALATLMAFSLPLLVQSVRQVRIDCWVFACAFLICGLLVRKRLRSAAALAAATPFIWPSAVLLFPLYLAVHLENGGKVRELWKPALVFVAAVTVCLLPIVHILSATFIALHRYYSSVGHSAVGTSNFSLLSLAQSIAVPLVKEGLRAPFFFLLVAVGAWTSLRNRRILLGLAAVAWVLALASGMHTFRFIFLMPMLLVFATEALERTPRLSRPLAVLAIVVGFAGFWSIVRPHPQPRLDLAGHLGKPPCTLLVPGYSRYYDLRKVGYVQLAIDDGGGYGDTNRVAALLKRCDAVLVEKEDRYTAIEESYSPYGILRDYCLESARRESGESRKSFPAKIGEAFAYGLKTDISDLLSSRGYTVRHRDDVFTIWKRGP